MSGDVLMAVVIAGAIALVVPQVLLPILRRYGVADEPNERSSHTARTLRGGGIAPLAGLVAGTAVYLGTSPSSAWGVPLVIAATTLSAALLGFCEDLRGVSVVARAGMQLLIGLGSSAALAVLLGQPVWWIPIGAMSVAAYVNIANFMDGLNGVSGMHGLVAGSAYGLTGIALQLPWLSAIGFITAAVFCAFLPWNLTSPGLFLGDVGSYLLGAVLSSLAVASMMSGVPVVTALSPLAIYAADALATIARRATRGEPVLRPHRTHAYQRLTDTGLSHFQSSVIVASFSALTASVGWLLLLGVVVPLAAGGLILVACAIYLLLPAMRGHVVPRPPDMLLPTIELPSRIPARSDYLPQRVVVLGGSGFVGTAVVSELLHAGHDVVSCAAPRLFFSPGSLDAPAILDVAGREGTHLHELASAFNNADAVVNAAGCAEPDSAAGGDLYGANALLPAVVALAASAAGVSRVVHVSSAAVQGRNPVLDGTLRAAPFSPYSHSKALGERAFLEAAHSSHCDLVVVRATSVQGEGRRTTESLRRIARSSLASVAAPGTQPTVVSSIHGLAAFVSATVRTQQSIPPILVQPWEGFSVQEVLYAAGGKPRTLPRSLCHAALSTAFALGRVVPEVAGAARRLEMMWFGQRQAPETLNTFSPVPREHLEAVLSGRVPPQPRETSR